MATLEVRTYPDPCLSQVSEPIVELSREQRFIDDLIETMYENDGVGIAAPQVGVSKQIIVVSPEGKVGTEKVYINPKILSQDGEALGLEGCLSLPGISGEVKRATKITLRAQDREGKTLEFISRDFEARVFQHEIDHLHGKLFIDRLGFRRRQQLISEIRKLAKAR
jgi:peptide deformylase